jgi:hypothetical protein
MHVEEKVCESGRPEKEKLCAEQASLWNLKGTWKEYEEINKYMKGGRDTLELPFRAENHEANF